MRVLGIDPGLRNMGWGVIDTAPGRISHVANGVCHSSGEDLAERLLSLHVQLVEVIGVWTPDVAAIEQTFVNKDAVGTLKLGQARGVALMTLAQAGLRVGEYAPNAVKKTVVGVGHAAKDHRLDRQQPRIRGQIDLQPAFHGGTVKHNRFLWQPIQTRALIHTQAIGNTANFARLRAIKTLCGLSCDHKMRIRLGMAGKFEPVAPGDAPGSVQSDRIQALPGPMGKERLERSRLMQIPQTRPPAATTRRHMHSPPRARLRHGT